MPSCFANRANADTRILLPVFTTDYKTWLKEQPAEWQAWLAATGFKGEAGEVGFLPAIDGPPINGKEKRPAQVVIAVEAPWTVWSLAGLPASLPEGRFRLEADLTPDEATRLALGWALGCYRFARYRKNDRPAVELVWPAKADRKRVESMAVAISEVRDLVNMPAGDLGPEQLAEAALDLAKSFKAKAKVTVGEALLKNNYPAIHTVGRAAEQAPRLIDFSWGNKSDPKITLVGKGVCFDTGGLDLKPSGGMLMMKKDMGGAAQALGLARMIMAAGLKLRLRVLIPAVENAVSGNAFHPMDIIRMRNGLSVEVGNTDAEGRLILADALAEADSEKPALLIDFATLTGAARVALGPDLPAFYCNDEETAGGLLAAADQETDPFWRLPLYQPYKRMLKNKIADLSSTGSGGFAGSITAALFLQHFVSETTPWVHFDVYAWNPSDRPGRPEGGEAQAIRAVFAYLAGKYGKG
ncbi:MAG: leucyl aminopeptidase family protein [Oceanibaculum nanhaiense]|uniref:leucyl aminopeptidase family protein n=1 Tax=Oceanibaculum nanhaiense TaxID=1909734 RepID=UPI0025A46961|nr:leucyl aminopeptidase family protein [Oceanibaculum nanhaiense]MDM7945694.1 leucyl aminopeptidase family protein [Oceanibaculum nanhaiense]